MNRFALFGFAALGAAVVVVIALSGSDPDEMDRPEGPRPETARGPGARDPGALSDEGAAGETAKVDDAGNPDVGTGALRVVVRDEEGAPLAGVNVVAAPEGPNLGSVSQSSNDSGHAAFADLPADEVNVTVGGHGFFVRESRSVTLEKDKELEAVFIVRRGGMIRGRVVTESGGPPAVSFRVAVLTEKQGVRYASPHAMATGGTNYDAGTEAFEIPGLAPGTYVVVANAKDHMASTSRAIEVGAGVTTDDDIQIVLKRGASLSGVVVDAGGSPVAGAAVSTGPPGGRFTVGQHNYSWDGQGAQKATTGEDGSFHIGGIRPGKIGLAAVADGFAPGRISSLTIEEGRESTGNVIKLPRGGTLTGTVRDKDGKPVADAPLLVGRVWPGVKFHGEFGRRIQTAHNGMYRLANLEPGRYKVSRPEAGGSASISVVMETGEDDPPEDDDEDIVTVSEGQVTVKDLTAVDKASIKGVVRSDDGKPLRKQVNLSEVKPGAEEEKANPLFELPNMQLSDERGAFTFEGLKPGTWELRIGTHVEKVTIAAGETRELEIRVPVCALEGVAVDSAGHPVANANVYPQRQRREDVFVDMMTGGENIRTDDQGRFAIPNLDPGGWVVMVQSETAKGKSKEVTIAAGETRKGLRVTVLNLVQMELTVVDAAGKPMAGQWVGLMSGANHADSQETSALGVARFQLLPGKYQVQLHNQPGATKFSPKEFTVADEPLRKTLVVE